MYGISRSIARIEKRASKRKTNNGPCCWIGLHSINISIVRLSLYHIVSLPIFIHDALIIYHLSFYFSDRSYKQNYLFGENAITKCGGSAMGFAAFENGLWGIGFGGSPNYWL